jgi:hypothetical protein
MPSVMRFLLVLAAVVSHFEALRLFPGSRTRGLVAMQVSDPAQLQKENKLLTQIADANQATANANQRTVEVYAKLLEKIENTADQRTVEVYDKLLEELEDKNRRQLVELSEFAIQFATRTIVCSMLQLAAQQSNAPGGKLFNDFLSKSVLDSGGRKLTKESQAIYQQIRKLVPFQSLQAQPDVGWVAQLTRSYPVMNGDMHKLYKLKGEGLACGGDSLDQMFLHTFIVACLQNYLINESISIQPRIYANVAVLSADFSEVVGRVTNGEFVEETPLPAKKSR